MNEYTIISKIGGGNEGVVYLASKKNSSQSFAIKKINCASEEDVKRLKKEVRIRKLNRLTLRSI